MTHREKYTDESMAQCMRLTKKLHGDETRTFVQKKMTENAKKVSIQPWFCIFDRPHLR